MGKPILLLHGALGSEEQLFSLKQILSESREVYTLNFEGHGSSNSDSDFSIPLFRNNIISFLKEKNLESVDIFGFSMGGYVALDLASHNPELVGRIVTLGTKFSWDPSFAAGEMRMLNPDKMLEKVPDFAAYLQKLHGLENWRNVVLKTANFMKELGDNPTLTASELKNISNHVLICLGEFDKMSTAEESKMVADWLPNGTFKLIANFKHPLESVSVDELAEIITKFLKK